jgi:5-formyltetrahydrofolate cyclo-ligase
MESKRELRRLIAARKRKWSDASLDELSLRVLTNLENLPLFMEADTVLLYHSLPDEVRTWDFVDRWSRTKRIVLPVVVGEELELRPYEGREHMRVGAYGILEPDTTPLTDYNSIELAVIPGVAFTSSGARLGRGKGYYDRLLPKIRARKVGVCFPFQMLDNIPVEQFDIVMDMVVTA